MSEFLDEFLKGEKTPEEKAMLAKQEAEKKHDVMRLDLSGFDDEAADDEEEFGGCGTPSAGCGGCGCRS